MLTKVSPEQVASAMRRQAYSDTDKRSQATLTISFREKPDWFHYWEKNCIGLVFLQARVLPLISIKTERGERENQ